ncbi:MAG: efflux transporter outer membrane subunit [Puniceicoccales bacterium]|jgi:multidrug efflux system outer membrane protein|nr:efflux transporter outer membrane subunit [Puniceicoccales bacterium]
MPSRHIAKLSAAILPLLVAGCAVGPDFKTPEIQAPAQWRGEPPAPTLGENATFAGLCPTHAAEPEDYSIADLPWWEVFKDPFLQTLVREALENSTDIRVTLARLDAARAAAGIANSTYYPSVAYAGTAFRNNPKSTTMLPNAGGFTFGGTVNWELDIWGRVRRMNEASFAQFAATVEARNASVLSLVAAVATSYFNLQALDAKHEIAVRTHELRSKTFWLASEKLDKEVGNQIDTFQFEAEMLAAKADALGFKQAVEQQENAICVLLGRTPGKIERSKNTSFKPVFEAVPAGIPSDVLQRRPDLRAAAQNVRVANAQIGANIANYFPQITLTGVLGFASPQLKHLFDRSHSASQGGGSLFGPLFDAGATYYAVREAKARTREAIALYEKTALTAFAEVNDALQLFRASSEQLEDLANIVDRREKVLDKLQQAKDVGTLSLFPIIDADRYLYASKLALVDMQTANLSAAVQLYKALGGGWRSADLKYPLVNVQGKITDGPGSEKTKADGEAGRERLPDTKRR